MSRIAIITGASSGLGQEFVRQLDDMTLPGSELARERAARDEARNETYDGSRKDVPLKECVLDFIADIRNAWETRSVRVGIERPNEIWVIARRLDRLEALTDLTEIPIRGLPCDLTDKESIRRLQAVLDEEQPEITTLINAAGYGKIGLTEGLALEDVEGMVDLNCRAAVAVTQICLPYMHRGARILEICSIAGFQPITRLNVYSATKAFLYHYSRGLRAELMPRGIVVTAVCPYWVKDTEFIGIAESRDGSKGAAACDAAGDGVAADLRDAGNADIKHYPLATKRISVVRRALLDAGLGLAVSTPGIVSTLQRGLRKILPIDVMILAWEGIRRV